MRLSEHQATRIAWKIRDVHHQHMHLLHGILAKYKLFAGQPRILFTISRLKNASQREIAGEMNVSPASLSMSIKRMQKAGLLVKKQDPDDLRSNRVELSETGRIVDTELKKELLELDRYMLKDFSGEEMQQLQEMLERIEQNISAYKENIDGF